MFWKLIRWGGSLVVILLVLAAAMLAQTGEDGNTQAQPVPGQPVQPSEVPPPQQNKNFNL